jgi:hypothetical protein
VALHADPVRRHPRRHGQFHDASLSLAVTCVTFGASSR